MNTRILVLAAIAVATVLTLGAGGHSAAPATAPVVSRAQAPESFDRAWGEVRGFFVDLLEEQGMVGGSLWLFSDGEPMARELYGFADVEEGQRVDENTVFHWGSITKTFTGIAIMQLRDKGLLGLDDPVIDYIPELRQVHNPYGDMREITIRHLMSHSAGFRNPTWPWGGSEPWHPHEPTSWGQLVAMLPYTEILFEPGSEWSYSNPGIIFLGRIIEQLSGDDYEVYIDKNIFSPLEMHASYFDHTPYHLLRNRANNYLVVDGEPQAQGLDFDTGITVSNGGLNAPIPDMAKYLAFLVGAAPDPELQPVYDQLLTRQSLEEMWQGQVGISAPDAPADLRESMGLTYFALETDDLRLIGHTGSQKAYFSFFYIDPVARTAAIAAFNAQGVPDDEGVRKPDARAVVNALRAKLFERFFPLFQ